MENQIVNIQKYDIVNGLIYKKNKRYTRTFMQNPLNATLLAEQDKKYRKRFFRTLASMFVKSIPSSYTSGVKGARPIENAVTAVTQSITVSGTTNTIGYSPTVYVQFMDYLQGTPSDEVPAGIWHDSVGVIQPGNPNEVSLCSSFLAINHSDSFDADVLSKNYEVDVHIAVVGVAVDFGDNSGSITVVSDMKYTYPKSMFDLSGLQINFDYVQPSVELIGLYGVFRVRFYEIVNGKRKAIGSQYNTLQTRVLMEF